MCMLVFFILYASFLPTTVSYLTRIKMMENLSDLRLTPVALTARISLVVVSNILTESQSVTICLHELWHTAEKSVFLPSDCLPSELILTEAFGQILVSCGGQFVFPLLQCLFSTVHPPLLLSRSPSSCVHLCLQTQLQ